MKIKMIPIILMLSAGATTSIVCYVLNYEIHIMLVALIVTLLVFYFAGDVIRYCLKKYVFPEPEKAEEEKTDETNPEENGEEQATLKDKGKAEEGEQNG